MNPIHLQTKQKNKGMNAIFLIFKLIGKAWNIAFPTHPSQVTITKTTDGDSLEGICKDGITHKIRLQGIDAPELGQDHGWKSKSALAKLVQGKTVSLENPETDKFGRTAANVVTPDKKRVEEILVAQGDAWACDYRATHRQKRAQKSAQQNKNGLWANPNAKAPWKYRKNKGKGTDGPDIF